MKPSLFLRLAAVVLVILLGGGARAADDPEVAPFAGVGDLQATHEARVRWFREARFGMFIHWGLYSAAGGYWPPDRATGKRYEQSSAEWIRTWASVPEPDYGKALRPLFAPEPGCTEAWARLAREAGMRYAVFTAKHHEGYTLFNSRHSYSLGNPLTGGTNISPAGRDLFGEYVHSFREAGVTPGVYYSLIDWQYPEPATLRAYLGYQLSELALNYGPLGILWVDYSSAGEEGSHWGTRSILENWQALQPAAIFNNRFWKGLENSYGDFSTPERYVPPAGYATHDFEVCQTLDDSFGYRAGGTKWKTSRDVLLLLSDVAGKGGNLLLNVGPDAKGRIPEPAVHTLQGVGRWLATHGEAIYGTSASPFRTPPFTGGCTVGRRDGLVTLYCHLTEWPSNRQLSLSGLATPLASARLLGATPLELEVVNGPLARVRLPESAPDREDLLPVVAVELAGEPVIDYFQYPQQASDRSVTLMARDAVLAPGPGSSSPLRMEDDHIGFWSSDRDSAWFPFMISQPRRIIDGREAAEAGRFKVTLEVAVGPEGGGEAELLIADQRLKIKVQPTGSWQQYLKLEAGRISLSQPGLLSLHVRPASMRGRGLMNLRVIRLEPVD